MRTYQYILRRNATADNTAKWEAPGYYITPGDVTTYKAYDTDLDVVKTHVDELRAQGIEAWVVREAFEIVYP